MSADGYFSSKLIWIVIISCIVCAMGMSTCIFGAVSTLRVWPGYCPPIWEVCFWMPLDLWISESLPATMYSNATFCLTMRIFILEVRNLWWYTDSARLTSVILSLTMVKWCTWTSIHMFLDGTSRYDVSGVVWALIALHLSSNVFASSESLMIQDFYAFCVSPGIVCTMLAHCLSVSEMVALKARVVKLDTEVKGAFGPLPTNLKPAG